MQIDSMQFDGPCSCGHHHTMATRLCVIEEDALAHLDDWMAQVGLQGKRCVVFDSNTVKLPQSQNIKGQQQVVLAAEGLHANEASTSVLLEQLEEDVEILLAVGGGTVHDIVRFCAHKKKLPFVAIPTAASCDGFCSTVAAMTWEGYKKTMPCVAPLLVVADTNILHQAPWALTCSGFGDMIGKFVALADWRMAHAVTEEEVCSRIYQVMEKALHTVWDNAQALKEGKKEAYAQMMYGLLMSGIAMQMLGTSRPASGGEHHISHFIEVEPAIIGIHTDASHGEKVGVGTVLASDVYHDLVGGKKPTFKVYEEVSPEQLMEIFGPKVGPAAVAENEEDCLRQVTPEALAGAWSQICDLVATIPEAEAIDARLQSLGAKHTLEDIGIPADKKKDLIRYSPLIRNRLTLMRMRRMIVR